MKKTAKPTVRIKCSANAHAASYERIIEFSAQDGKGGLISIRHLPSGEVVVEPYCLDDGVKVMARTSRLIICAATDDWYTLAKDILSGKHDI